MFSGAQCLPRARKHYGAASMYLSLWKNGSSFQANWKEKHEILSLQPVTSADVSNKLDCIIKAEKEQ